MKVGDIVEAAPGRVLRCGSGWYPNAVIVSMDPFTLVSEEGDMMWSVTFDKEDVVPSQDRYDTSKAFARYKRECNV